MLSRLLQVSTVPHRHVVALLIRGLTIRFLFKRKAEALPLGCN
jgi:hypothetical protein